MITAEQKSKILNRLSVMSLGVSEQILSQMIDDAAEHVELWTNRSAIPDRLVGIVGDFVIIACNRRGTEGETGRSEGGESYSFDNMPERIYSKLRNFRLARAGGKSYEDETE